MTVSPADQDQPEQWQLQPTLPLLYLPVELAEEISQYFEGQTAAKLLRVSRSFHSLFLPRVWTNLDTFAVIDDDEARRHMLERHGHFVRTINLATYTVKLLTFDWLPFVTRAAYLESSITCETTAEETVMLMKLIRQSRMLRTLSLRFDKYNASVKFDDLAAAINKLENLERVSCEFGTDHSARSMGCEWKKAVSFVEMLHPSKRSKLRLRMYVNAIYNEVDVQALAPYIVKLEAYGGSTCTALLAHEFFGIKDTDGQQLVFPQLKELSMTSCCFNTEGNDIKSITASRLPQLQLLHFSNYSCDLLARDELDENEHEKYNWKSEYSGYAHIIVPSQRWHSLTKLYIGIVSSSILMNIIDLNPQLEQLIVGSIHSNLPKVTDASKYNHDQFQLDAILDHLPRLVNFSIGRLNSRITVDSAAIPRKRRFNMRITIGCHMSVTPSAVVYLMQMPRLTSLSFDDCVFVDMDETIQLLQGNAEKFQKLLDRSVMNRSLEIQLDF
ncbi:hypothetical protein GQ42DRAFT_164997 [Ramicandelaber brevisporus]|nr:hypothetical protein GQ42DRAFT_164997 [Ramicandelaber brevisporus]